MHLASASTGLDVGVAEARVRTGHADRGGDGLGVQSARRDLGEHRGEEQEVAAAHQGHVERHVSPVQLFEALRGPHAGEAAS